MGKSTELLVVVNDYSPQQVLQVLHESVAMQWKALALLRNFQRFV